MVLSLDDPDVVALIGEVDEILCAAAAPRRQPSAPNIAIGSPYLRGDPFADAAAQGFASDADRRDPCRLPSEPTE